MSEPTELSYIAETIRGLFPFLARFGLTPGPSGKLSIRAAAEGIVIDALEAIAIGASAKAVQLAGGTLPVARKTDGTGFWYVVVSSGVVVAVYWSAENGLASSWSLVASGPAPPVDGVTVGTATSITSGSGKVSSG
jgi:hypothetical protein